MSSLLLSTFLVLIAFLFGGLACGVKGNPMPPEQPPVLGRGDRSFSKATQGMAPRKNKDQEDDSTEPVDVRDKYE